MNYSTTLSFSGNPDRNSNPGSSEPGRCELIHQQHVQRDEVESFIATRFYLTHRAHIISFMPEIFTIRDENHRILAALGLRVASEQSLFVENYLETSVECSIAEQFEGDFITPGREQIVEIGNLASIDRKASLALFVFLASYLLENKYRWAVFTACPALQFSFRRMGLELVNLCPAREIQLPEDQQTWGEYYDHNPSVLAGMVDSGKALFRHLSRLDSKYLSSSEASK